MLAFGEFDLVETWLANRQVADPLNSSAWEDLVILHARRGEFDRAVDVLDETRRRFGETDRMRERAIVLAMLRNDPATAIDTVARGFDLTDDYNHFLPLRLGLEGDPDGALQVAERLDDPNSHYWKNYDLFWTYFALGDQARMRALVTRTDGVKPGPVIMLIDMAITGVLRLPPEDTPVFRARLMEAGIDPTTFRVLAPESGR